MFANARARQRAERLLPELRVVHVQWLSLFAYPLSGGFKRWCAWPAALVRPGLAIEDTLLPSLGALLAFRLFVVLERQGPSGSSSSDLVPA